jgi:hypothetical protein
MVFCTACGQRLAGGERFCGHCGAPLPDTPDTAGTAPTARADPAEPSAAPAPPDTPPPDTPPPDTPSPDTPPPAAQSAPSPAAAPPGVPFGSAARPDVSAPRWPVGSGPIPLPPRSPVVRRAVIVLGLPFVLVAAGLVALFALVAALQSGPSPSDAVPRIATPLTPTTPTPTAPSAPVTAGGGITGDAATSTPPATTSTAPRITATTALQQARAVENLLDVAARTPVAATVASLARCDPTTLDAPTAATALQAAATSRSELLRRLQDVPVDELPDGPALKASLQETWTQWQNADERYLTWAQGIVSGSPCNPQDPFKLAGDVAAGAAGRAGTEFVAAWNTKVARPLHLPARQVRNL